MMLSSCGENKAGRRTAKGGYMRGKEYANKLTSVHNDTGPPNNTGEIL